MSFTTIAAILSTILGIYCAIPYIISIINGKTKPHQFSWLVFAIMNGIVFFSQLLEGGRESVIVYGIFFVGSTTNFLLSLKYGVRDTSKWDKLLFGFALFTIAVWVVTRSNATAIWLTVLIDVFATTMIILKLHAKPHSEAPLAWILATAATGFGLLTLLGRPLSILYVRPVYGIICNLVLIAFIYYYRRTAKSESPELSPLENS